jgi:hypothetical protein
VEEVEQKAVERLNRVEQIEPAVQTEADAKKAYFREYRRRKRAEAKAKVA